MMDNKPDIAAHIATTVADRAPQRYRLAVYAAAYKMAALHFEGTAYTYHLALGEAYKAGEDAMRDVTA